MKVCLHKNALVPMLIAVKVLIGYDLLFSLLSLFSQMR